MNNETNKLPENTWDYFWLLWPEKTAQQKQRWLIFFMVVLVLWITGSFVAYQTMDGIQIMKNGSSRLLGAAFVGGWGWVWWALETLGAIQENAQQPSLSWILFFLAGPGVIGGIGYLLFQPGDKAWFQERLNEARSASQGRLKAQEAAEKLGMEVGVPSAQVQVETPKPAVKVIGLDYHHGEGHMMVIGPTGCGKGLHLTETLLTWPGAVCVIDPKAEQFVRTARYRQRQFNSPVYRLPGHQVDLARLYGQFTDDDEVAELHHHWLRPWQSNNPIFAQKCLDLFKAAFIYARHHHLPPLQVLLDAAANDPRLVLADLETVPEAKRHVRIFTNGTAPADLADDRFATSAYGTFTTMLSKYQKHFATMVPAGSMNNLPLTWVEEKASLYITYTLQDLHGAGGVVAAVLAGLMRQQMRSNRRERLLVAIDELPAVGLENIGNYLATVRGYGITLLLYAQAVSQLEQIYGRDGHQAILANCMAQVWYPPSEVTTARLMSELFGDTMRPRYSQSSSTPTYTGNSPTPATRQLVGNQGWNQSWNREAVLNHNEMMSLAKGQVLVQLKADRLYRLIAQRLNPVPRFASLEHPPKTPEFRSRLREYTVGQTRPQPQATAAPWLPDVPGNAQGKTGDPSATTNPLPTEPSQDDKAGIEQGILG